MSEHSRMDENSNEHRGERAGVNAPHTLLDRRGFLQLTAAGAASVILPGSLGSARADAMNGRAGLQAAPDLATVRAEITKRHDEAVRRLQTWIRQPSIAAKNRGMEEGCQLMIQMLREAGFDTVKRMPTSGHPGVFARLDAGAPRTLGIYFMYDVKQADPAEWSSPPFAGALVQKPGLGTVLIGRGATNQKGPEATFLAALHAIRGAGRKVPVNLVFVAEGEEEIGSPHFPQSFGNRRDWARCANVRASTCRCPCSRWTAT